MRAVAVPGLLVEFDVFFVEFETLGRCERFPLAVLTESERIVEDATADHDAVEAVLFGELFAVLAVHDVAIAD